MLFAVETGIMHQTIVYASESSNKTWELLKNMADTSKEVTTIEMQSASASLLKGTKHKTELALSIESVSYSLPIPAKRRLPFQRPIEPAFQACFFLAV